MAGDRERALGFLDPATRHNLQNDPKSKDAFTRFIQTFKSSCGNAPIKDTVITQEIQQPVRVARVEVLLGRPCKVPYYGSYTLGSLVPAFPERVSISLTIGNTEGKWYPVLQ